MNKIEYQIVSSGSKGNSVIYREEYAVDMGVLYRDIFQYLDKIKVILLTHRHTDHLHKPTVKRIVKDYPEIKWLCGEHLQHIVKDCGVVPIIIEAGKIYQVGNCKINPISLYHDVPNFGYRFYFDDGYKIIHATDTFTLDGISAKGFDLYSLEYNHDELIIEKEIEEKLEKGEYCYEIGARNSHLSFQKCIDFFNKMKSDKSELLKLHISHKYKGEKNENDQV